MGLPPHGNDEINGGASHHPTAIRAYPRSRMLITEMPVTVSFSRRQQKNGKKLTILPGWQGNWVWLEFWQAKLKHIFVT